MQISINDGEDTIEIRPEDVGVLRLIIKPALFIDTEMERETFIDFDDLDKIIALCNEGKRILLLPENR